MGPSGPPTLSLHTLHGGHRPAIGFQGAKPPPGGASAYRGQRLEQAVEACVPEAPQAGEGGQEPQEEVGHGDEGRAAQHPVEAQRAWSARTGDTKGKPGTTTPFWA